MLLLEIHSDCWKGYENLEKHSYKHKTLNYLIEIIGLNSEANYRIIMAGNEKIPKSRWSYQIWQMIYVNFYGDEI